MIVEYIGVGDYPFNIRYIRPIRYLNLYTLEYYRKRALSTLEGLILECDKNPSEYTVREVTAKDLINNEEWIINYNNKYTEEKIISVELPEDKFVVFYGYANLSTIPKTLSLKFTDKENKTTYYIPVLHVYAFQDKVGYFDIIGYKEKEQINVFGVANDKGQDKFILLGFVAEK